MSAYFSFVLVLTGQEEEPNLSLAHHYCPCKKNKKKNTSHCETFKSNPQRAQKAKRRQRRAILVPISSYFSARRSGIDREEAPKVSILSALSVAKASGGFRNRGGQQDARIERGPTKQRQGENVVKAFVHLLRGTSWERDYKTYLVHAKTHFFCSLTLISVSLTPFVFPRSTAVCLSVSISSSCGYHDTQQYAVQMDKHRSSLLCVFLYICYCMCGQRSVRAPSNLCAYVWALPLCKCNVCDRLASNVITLMHVFLIIPRTVDDLLPQQHASHLFDCNCHVALYLWHIYHKSWPWWSIFFLSS